MIYYEEVLQEQLLKINLWLKTTISDSGHKTKDARATYKKPYQYTYKMELMEVPFSFQMLFFSVNDHIVILQFKQVTWGTDIIPMLHIQELGAMVDIGKI